MLLQSWPIYLETWWIPAELWPVCRFFAKIMITNAMFKWSEKLESLT